MSTTLGVTKFKISRGNNKKNLRYEPLQLKSLQIIPDDLEQD